MSDQSMSRAELASRDALDQMFAAIRDRRSFVLEAGAGAGKTYSLVAALKHLIERARGQRGSRGQTACITYTNVAKNEIRRRIDNDPRVYCDTIHGFCWSLIAPFQQQLRNGIAESESWRDRIAESSGIGKQDVSYDLGFRSIKQTEIKIGHDDVIALTVKLMARAKFRILLAERFPAIFIDEYQDTSLELVDSFKKHFIDNQVGPLLGFFGDHWQQIYQRTCGKIEHPNLLRIEKHANFRSSVSVVDVLNNMRPELKQEPHRTDEPGQAVVFHTNGWEVERQEKGHWKGDLTISDSRLALRLARHELEVQGWDLDPSKTKVLMLTHRLLANEQGYASLPEIFSRNERFVDLEDRHIAFFVEVLEPALQMYQNRRYGAMFDLLEGRVPVLRSPNDKKLWSNFMAALSQSRTTGSVSDVLTFIREAGYLRIPDTLDDRERELQRLVLAGEEVPSYLKGLDDLLSISYSEIVMFSRYHREQSPFSTKHRVKGAEFQNVIVVVGRGWNLYNFDKMLANFSMAKRLSPRDRRSFELNRNLFYVACSRPRDRLAVLFTQELSGSGIDTLTSWFGDQHVRELSYSRG